MLRLHSVVGVLAASLCLASCSAPKAPDVVPPPSAAPAELGYDELVRGAQSYLDAGKTDRALAVADRAVKLDATRPEAFIVMARAYATQEQLGEAAARYEQARALGAKDRALWVELASVYDVAGRYDAAIELYRAYLADHPNDAEFHQELGLTLLLTKRAAEAVSALERAVALAPHELQARQDLGYALLTAGDAQKAATVLGELVRLDRSLGEAWRFLAQALAASGRLQEALGAADRAVAEAKAGGESTRLRARLRLAAGDAKGSLADWETLGALSSKDPALLLGASGALIALERLDEAQRLVDEAERAAKDHPWVSLRRAQLAWRRGDKRALATLVDLGEKHGASLEIWREVYSAARKLGDKAALAKATAKLTELGQRPR